MALNHPRLEYPVAIHRRVDRNWQRRMAAVPVRARSLKRDHAAACPLCHAAAPIAPIASVYRGAGLIHHHWLCTPCGHAWTTAVRVSGVKP